MGSARAPVEQNGEDVSAFVPRALKGGRGGKGGKSSKSKSSSYKYKYKYKYKYGTSDGIYVSGGSSYGRDEYGRAYTYYPTYCQTGVGTACPVGNFTMRAVVVSETNFRSRRCPSGTYRCFTALEKNIRNGCIKESRGCQNNLTAHYPTLSCLSRPTFRGDSEIKVICYDTGMAQKLGS